MQSIKHVPSEFHQSMTEVAEILAQGYMRIEKIGVLVHYSVRLRWMRFWGKNLSRLHQKPLDSSSRSSVHAEKISCPKTISSSLSRRD